MLFKKLNNSLMSREFPTKLKYNQTQHKKYVKNVNDHKNNLKCVSKYL